MNNITTESIVSFFKDIYTEHFGMLRHWNLFLDGLQESNVVVKFVGDDGLVVKNRTLLRYDFEPTVEGQSKVFQSILFLMPVS